MLALLICTCTQPLPCADLATLAHACDNILTGTYHSGGYLYDFVKPDQPRGSVRRDLKLDNTLLDNSKPPVLKLCDVRGPHIYVADIYLPMLPGPAA